MRIVDYLNSDEDDETAAPESRNSRKTRRLKLVSRLFSFTWKCGRGSLTRRTEHEQTEEEEEDEDCQIQGDSDGAPRRICERCGTRFATCQNLTSGRNQQELNFNLVAGLALLSLVAVNKMELEKTVQLRRQMESFFENLKQEGQTKNKISEQSDSEISCLNENDQQVVRHCDHHLCDEGSPEISTAPSDITLVCDQFPKSDTSSKEECIEGMNQFENLEVELETELELLQLHLQTEEWSQHQWQIRESAETEMVYHQQEDDIEQCGVNPYELERRLNKVIEARQGERIRELESALIQTKQKLQL